MYIPKLQLNWNYLRLYSDTKRGALFLSVSAVVTKSEHCVTVWKGLGEDKHMCDLLCLISQSGATAGHHRRLMAQVLTDVILRNRCAVVYH